jgi:HEAT repeat protein
MISTQRARLPVVRILSRTRHVLGLLVSRLPVPVQERATSALQALAARWPRLAGLLGLATATRGAREVDRRVAASDEVNGVVASAQARAASLEALRSAADLVDRIRAARTLASIRDEETTAALAAALRDASAEVAVEAAEALGKHRGPGATRALRAALDNSDGYYSPMTRAASVRALGAILPADEAALIANAVTNVDPMVSLAAIAALAERDEPASRDALATVLENRAGFYLPLTRQAAARALLQLRRWDEEKYRTLLENEADATVRESLVALRASS